MQIKPPDNEHLESLLPQPKKDKNKQPSCMSRLCGYLFPTKQTVPRKIHLTGKVNPPNYFENKVENRKYSVLTFVPAVLLGLLFTYIAPLAFVLFLTMLKEAYDDLKRYWKDKEANSTKYRFYTFKSNSS